jgi:hypothetical protein
MNFCNHRPIKLNQERLELLLEMYAPNINGEYDDLYRYTTSSGKVVYIRSKRSQRYGVTNTFISSTQEVKEEYSGELWGGPTTYYERVAAVIGDFVDC